MLETAYFYIDYWFDKWWGLHWAVFTVAIMIGFAVALDNINMRMKDEPNIDQISAYILSWAVWPLFVIGFAPYVLYRGLKHILLTWIKWPKISIPSLFRKKKYSLDELEKLIDDLKKGLDFKA